MQTNYGYIRVASCLKVISRGINEKFLPYSFIASSIRLNSRNILTSSWTGTFGISQIRTFPDLQLVFYNVRLTDSYKVINNGVL